MGISAMATRPMRRRIALISLNASGDRLNTRNSIDSGKRHQTTTRIAADVTPPKMNTARQSNCPNNQADAIPPSMPPSG
jgi:hypothetical protein